jgi:putative ABC transport system permease protein
LTYHSVSLKGKTLSLTLPRRNFTRHRWRTFLIILGIAISVGIETGIAVTVDSLYDDFIENHRGNNFTDITIHSINDSTFLEMQELEKQVQDIKGVKKASLVATFTLVDLPSFIENRPEFQNITNSVILYGFEPDQHPDFPQLVVERGNKTLDENNNEVIISDSIAQLLHINPGDNFYFPKEAQYGFLGTTVTISGIINDVVSFGNRMGFLFVLIDLDYLIERFEDESQLNFHLVVQTTDFLDVNSITQRVEDTLGLDYIVLREKSISETDVLAIKSYQTAMNLIIIASFVVEFLFITNILTINIKERSKEFGVLRAVGTSKSQVIRFLGVELLFYGGLGSIIGNFVGIGFSSIIVFFLNLNYPQNVAIEALLLLPTSILSAFITGILITLIAGLYPIMVAINLPVVQNIHWKMRTKKTESRNWFVTLLTGIFLVLTGYITTYFIGPSRFLSFDIISWHFFVIGAVFTGTLILETGLLHFAPPIGKKLMFWHSKVPRIIATRNIKRENQKTTITIMVTALALAFILVIGIVSDAIIFTLPDYYDERFGRIDLIAETKDDAEVFPSFTNELVANNSNILRAGFIQQQRTTISTVQGYVFGINSSDFNYFFGETMLLSTGSDLFNTTTRGVVISHFLVAKIGLRVGENLTVNVSSQSSIQMQITGITSGNPFLQRGNYIFCSDGLFQNLWQNQSANWFIMSTGDEKPLKTMEEQLCVTYPVFSRCIGIDFYADVIENALVIQKAFFQTLFFHTFLLSGLAQFISILITTMKTEREVGIMRSMGLARGQVFSIFFAESTILGLLGVILGIINGLIGAELMAWYISQSLPIKTSISFDLIVFWMMVSLLITITSTIIPSYRSSTKNVVEAINAYIPRQLKAQPILWHNWEKMMDSYIEIQKVAVDSPLTRELRENGSQK